MEQKNKRIQWFKVTSPKGIYSELGHVISEDSNYCYLNNGKRIPVSEKCERKEFPLRPSTVKWKGL